MNQPRSHRPERISGEVMALLNTGQQVAPFSERYAGFDMAEAYEIVARVRECRQALGESPIGRKIGFTNRAVWGSLGISAPIWNYVFDSTVSDAPATVTDFDLVLMPEPRIEPEIVLHLSTAPAAGMNADELFACVDWIAAGYEVVYSIFPGWRFTAADAAAACGVHGALLVGPKHDVSHDRSQWAAALSSFDVEMTNDQGVSRKGHAHDVLGGPLEALRLLVEEVARYPSCEPLGAGELVTTGTLTEAMPAVPGQTWTTRFEGIALDPLRLRFR